MIKIKLGDTSIVKVNKMKIKNGTVIFLKSEDEITRKYDPKLRSLINSGHRFVTLAHSGPKSQCIAIGLLSTSKYLNEKKELGIKLSGNYKEYGNGKDVYMDSVNNLWLIRTNCIKEIAYNLEEIDIGRVLDDHLYYNSANLKIGIKEDGIINMNFPEFDFYFKNCKVSDEKRQKEVNVEFLEDNLIKILNSSDKELECYYNDFISDKEMVINGSSIPDFVEEFREEENLSKIEMARIILLQQLKSLRSSDGEKLAELVMEQNRKQYNGNHFVILETQN